MRLNPPSESCLSKTGSNTATRRGRLSRESRKNLVHLPDRGYGHLAVESQRAYSPLRSEWLKHVAHLLQWYPYLFSLALRTNSFDANPRRSLGLSVAAPERTSHLSSREYGQDSHENDDEKQNDKWDRQRGVGRLNVSAPIGRLEKGGSCEKEKHERNRRQ